MRREHSGGYLRVGDKETDPHEIHDRMVRAGDNWAEADAAARLLEDTLKTVLAQEVQKVMADGSIRGVERAESIARTSPAFIEHVKALAEARERANKSRVRWDSARVFTDLVRTVNANRRAELQNLGSV